MKNYIVKNTSIFALFIGLFLFVSHNVQAATLTWDGGGTTNNWSEAANWSGNSIPLDFDDVIFNSTSTKNVVIDVAISPLQFNMNAGYTGTISQGSSNVNVGDIFSQADGVFIGGSGTIDLDDFTLSGGTFTASSGNTYVDGSFTVSGTGVFEHNNGTMIFRGSLGSVNILTVEDFFNVQINKITNSSAFGINAGDTLRVNGTLTLTNGQIDGDGILQPLGPITIESTFDGGDGLLLVSGNNVQTITIPALTQMPRLTVNAPNTTINTSGVGTINFRTTEIQNVNLITNGSANFSFGNSFSYTQTGGTFTGGSGAVRFNNSFTVSGGTFTAPNGISVFAGDFTISGTGQFEHNNGSAIFTRTNNLDVLTNEEFHNLIIESTLANSFNIATGDTLRVIGILSLNDGQVSGGKIEAFGNMTVAALFDGGSSMIQFSGANSQSFANSGGINPTGIWTIDKPSGTINLGSNLDLSNGTDNLILTNGTITTGANVVIAGTRAISRTNGFINGNLQRTFASAGSQQFAVGTITGYSPATINATAGTFGATTTFTVGANNGTLGNASPTQSLTRNWSLNPSIGGITNANIRFDYLQTDVPSRANEANFVFLRRTSNSTTSQGITSINTTDNFATLNNVSTFSDWSLGTLAPTSASVLIGGRVLTESGRGVSNARITLIDSNGNARIALTNPFGYYRFNDINVGENYVLSVASKSYEFANPSQVVFITESLADINFRALNRY